MNYTIRKADLNDINMIVVLYQKLSEHMTGLQQEYLNLSKEEVGYGDEEKINYFYTVLHSSDNAVYVVEVNDEIVGFIQACINEKDFDFHLDKYCYIPYYYVEESYRNFTLNLDLYKAAEKWAYEKELKYICSDVDGANNISLIMQKKFCGMRPFKIRLMKQL